MCDTRATSRAPYLVSLSSSAISLEETVGAGAVLDGFGYDTATAFLAWKIMWPTVWMVVMPEPVARLLPFSVGPVPSHSSLLKEPFD